MTTMVPLNGALNDDQRYPRNTMKRLLDLILAASLIVFTLPVMIIVALAIKCNGPGPVIYRQDRVGRGGRPFNLLKFRSMVPNAEQDGPVWAAEQDVRVTHVGRIIRLLRIDELPQLLNVMRGEMSMVGPRPERPYFVDHLATKIPRFVERHAVTPGITGWAQINYPYGASIEDAQHKLGYDLYYIQHQSLGLDLSILISTVRVVIFQKGAR